MSQNGGSLQHILQLPNVPWPVIPREGFHRGCRNVVDCPAHSLCMFLNEVAGEQRYVFAAVPKRRYAQWKDVKPVVQICAKLVLVNHSLQVAVRSGYEAYVGPDRAGAAHSLEFLVLNGTSSHMASKPSRVAGGSENSVSRLRSGFSPSLFRKSIHRDLMLPAMCFTITAMEFISASNTVSSCSSVTCAIARSANFL